MAARRMREWSCDGSALARVGGENSQIRQLPRYMLETVRDRPVVAVEHLEEIIYTVDPCHFQAWTGHCAIVPWHRRPLSTNTGALWPLRNFLINKQ